MLVIPGSLHSQTWISLESSIHCGEGFCPTSDTTNTREHYGVICSLLHCLSQQRLCVWKPYGYHSLGVGMPPDSWTEVMDSATRLSQHSAPNVTNATDEESCFNFTYIYTQAHTQRWAVGGGGVSPLSQLPQ